MVVDEGPEVVLEGLTFGGVRALEIDPDNAEAHQQYAEHLAQIGHGTRVAVEGGNGSISGGSAGGGGSGGRIAVDYTDLAGQATVLVDNAHLFAKAEGGRRRLAAVLASAAKASAPTWRAYSSVTGAPPTITRVRGQLDLP